MKTKLLLVTAAASALIFIEPGWAGGPPAGVPMGPPASVTMGPPSSVTMGPPSSVTMGPPSSVTMGPPSSVTKGPPANVAMGPPAGAMAHIPSGAQAAAGEAQAANLLGNLNAAHASSTALEHASSKSIVGAVAQYKTAMLSARADISKYTDLVNWDQAAVDAAQQTLTDLQNSGTATQDQIDAAQTDLTDAQTQLSADQAQLDAANAEIGSAQTQLASSSNKELTPDAIAQVNALLGIN